MIESLEFPHNYGVDVAREAPADGKNLFYIPPRGRVYSAMLRIHASEFIWTAIFAGFENRLSGFWSMPSPDHLFVCCEGQGYVVNVIDPADWREAVCHPLQQVITDLKRGILVVADFDRLAAYDNAGVRWRTGQLSLDGIKIVGTDHAGVRVSIYSPPKDSWSDVLLSAETGCVIEGTIPDKELFGDSNCD